MPLVKNDPVSCLHELSCYKWELVKVMVTMQEAKLSVRNNLPAVDHSIHAGHCQQHRRLAELNRYVPQYIMINVPYIRMKLK